MHRFQRLPPFTHTTGDSLAQAPFRTALHGHGTFCQCRLSRAKRGQLPQQGDARHRAVSRRRGHRCHRPCAGRSAHPRARATQRGGKQGGRRHGHRQRLRGQERARWAHHVAQHQCRGHRAQPESAASLRCREGAQRHHRAGPRAQRGRGAAGQSLQDRCGSAHLRARQPGQAELRVGWQRHHHAPRCRAAEVDRKNLHDPHSVPGRRAHGNRRLWWSGGHRFRHHPAVATYHATQLPAERRSPAPALALLPDVPTFAEAGVKIRPMSGTACLCPPHAAAV